LVERLREVGPVDLIIDDGSHKLADQLAGAEALWDCLRIGGAYVVEDVQSESDGQVFGDRGWRLHDWSKQTGRWDDRIAIQWRKH
jgi:hypothetical protein